MIPFFRFYNTFHVLVCSFGFGTWNLGFGIFAAYAQNPPLSGAYNWAYQLQNINVSQIAADTFIKMMVIDYSLDGTDDFKFTQQEVAQMKSNNKLLFAYISIGEAEDYRFYWNPSWYSTPPAWLGPENPDWAGNYKVKFWDPQWQSIIFGYIDTIISQGFDGIYMDIIDAYYYWQVENPVEPLADSLMVQYILNIRNHITGIIGGNTFYMIPQNGEDVINAGNVSASLKLSWFDAIDAIGVEDVLFPGGLDEDNAYNPGTWRIDQLNEYIAAGKPVFSIEYLTQSSKIQQFVATADSLQYIPYACTRPLDQLCQVLITQSNTKPTGRIAGCTVSPNPAGMTLSINVNDSYLKKISVAISDPLGFTILKKEKTITPGTPSVIDISCLPSGIYFAIINNNYGFPPVKFLKL